MIYWSSIFQIVLVQQFHKNCHPLCTDHIYRLILGPTQNHYWAGGCFYKLFIGRGGYTDFAIWQWVCCIMPVHNCQTIYHLMMPKLWLLYMLQYNSTLKEYEIIKLIYSRLDLLWFCLPNDIILWAIRPCITKFVVQTCLNTNQFQLVYPISWFILLNAWK